ncbi:MAG: HupE/UreJ family protein [Opitutaceae bacterium]|jgi:urease accessory protein|nr:HupE/UreJ family protein [Opitutaceae bacterium]
MKPSTRKFSISCAALVAIAPSIALAHPGHEGDHGGLSWDFVGGFLHPLGGWDHLLAMVAIGLWAAKLGGKARWAVPMSFVVALIAGAVVGASGFVLGGLEQAIAASVVVLGLLIVSAARLPLAAGMAIAATFAVFHGIAHGSEMPATSSGFGFGVGFALATALLHGAGYGIGLLANRAPVWVTQGAGVGLVAAGGLMLAA